MRSDDRFDRFGTGGSIVIGAIFAGHLMIGAPAMAWAVDGDPWQACARAIAAAERTYSIPAKLLHAIAHAESARRNAAANSYAPWPWTVMARGQGRHFDTKGAAIEAVRTLREEDVSNIDVGCMQVNLGYHPHAFDDLDAAFDPHRNAAYAARFLKGLYRASGSWFNAVARYHSSTYRQNRQYKIRVLTLWRRMGGGLR